MFHDLSFSNVGFQVSFLTLPFHTLKGLFSSSPVSAFKQTFIYWYLVILALFIKKTDHFFPHEVAFTPLSEISWQYIPSSVINSVAQLCLALCNFMDCSLPGFPVHYQLPELAQTHVQSVMPFSHLILCRPLLLLPSIFPSIRVFSSESVLIHSKT